MKRFRYLLIISFIVVSTSCGDDFFNVNEDPNNPRTSSPELTFPAAQSALAFVYGGYYNIAGEIWSQHWTQSTGASQYRTFDDWDVSTSTLANQYAYLWNESLNDLDYVSEEAFNIENGSYHFAAEVLKAYIFQMLVDLYDRQPYSEGLKGDLGVLAPSYVSGESIYDSLLISLDQAHQFYQNDLAEDDLSPDLFLGGDMDSWVQFYNSLKLKILLRQSFVSERNDKVAAGLTALFSSEPEFLTETSVQMTQFGTAANSRNPVYESEVIFMGNVNLVASKNTIDFLRGDGTAIDPRMYEFFDASEDADAYVGQPQGDNATLAYGGNDDEFSKPNLGPQDPAVLMSAAEVNFLLAEAALRFPTQTGLTLADAQAYYEAGIEASFEAVGLEGGGAAVLYADGARYAFPTGSVEEQLEAIIVQKWVSFINTQGMEAYLEHKRTGYPKAEWETETDFIFTVPKNNVTGGRPIKRLQYSDEEVTRNPNVPDLVEATVPVWWDVR